MDVFDGDGLSSATESVIVYFFGERLVGYLQKSRDTHGICCILNTFLLAKLYILVYNSDEKYLNKEFHYDN